MKQISISYELKNDQYELIHNFLEEGFTLKQFINAWNKLDGTRNTLKVVFDEHFPYASIYLWEKFEYVMLKYNKPNNAVYSINNTNTI